MTPDVNVSLVDFKDCKGNEFVVQNEDGSYTIVINARLSNDGQLRAYHHAMGHINNNDFEKSDAQSIEFEAHNLQKSVSDPIPANKYLNRIKRIQRERRKIQRKMKEDEERVRFLNEYCDVFAIEGYRYRYGDDL